MGLESATYIESLDSANPAFNDPKAQGDDHLRLLKSTIKATFPGLAGRFRRFQAKSGAYGPVVTDNTSVLLCTTSLTLTLAAVSAYGNGWETIIVADGGDVTITPNGTEKVNGQATFVIPNGYAGILVASAIAAAEYYLILVPLTVVAGIGAAITGNITLTASIFGGLRTITASAIVTLPAIAGIGNGRSMRFKSLTTGDVTLLPNGAETIDGVAAAFRLPSYCEIELTKISTGFLITIMPAFYVGELKQLSAGIAAPLGWVRADAALISRTTYAGLFAVTSTAHGVGDGSTTFGVQDTRGRAIVGDGTGASLTARTVGDIFGTETHVLTEAQMPVHTHSTGFALSGGGISGFVAGPQNAIAVTGSAGSGAAHPNTQPSGVARFIVKT